MTYLGSDLRFAGFAFSKYKAVCPSYFGFAAAWIVDKAPAKVFLKRPAKKAGKRS